MIARIDAVRDAAAAAGLEAVVITSPASIRYLSGMETLGFERLFAVAVPVDGEPSIIVPLLDAEIAAGASAGLPVRSYDAASDGFGELAEALVGARRVGVEEDHLTLARRDRLAELGVVAEPAGAAIMRLRARKDTAELDAIRATCAAIATVYEALWERLRPGVTEIETNAWVAYQLAQAGASESHPLVLFGANAANPHGSPSARPLAAGDVVCADVSASIDGYWGDLTRCATAGPASDWARDAWSVICEAQDRAIAACRAGTPARDVDTAQREVVATRADLGAVLHGAGHAMGIEIHEPPFLVPRTADPLEAGHVLTIEPGLYATGVGGVRVEDDVAVTDGDPLLLSELPRELRELPA